MRLRNLILSFGLLLALVASAFADGPAVDPGMGLLRSTIGKFKSTWVLAPPDFPDTGTPPLITARTEYAGPNGSKVWVDLFAFRQDAQAYEFLSLLSAAARSSNRPVERISGIGTARKAT